MSWNTSQLWGNPFPAIFVETLSSFEVLFIILERRRLGLPILVELDMIFIEKVNVGKSLG